MRFLAMFFVVCLSFRLDAAALTKDQGLAMVLDYAIFMQHAYAWDGSNLKLDVNGRVYGLRKSQAPTVLPLTEKTKGCFGGSIDVAKDIFDLPEDEQSKWKLVGRIAVAESVKDAAIDKLPLSHVAIGSIKIINAILTGLEVYAEYQVEQARAEAKNIQAYIRMPEAESTIMHFLPKFQTALSKSQTMMEARVKADPDGKLNSGPSPRMITVAVNGRPGCFVSQ